MLTKYPYKTDPIENRGDHAARSILMIKGEKEEASRNRTSETESCCVSAPLRIYIMMTKRCRG